MEEKNLSGYIDDDRFQKHLLDTVMEVEPLKKNRNRIWKRAMIFTMAAAAVLLFITINQVLPSKDANIVYAMEKAMYNAIEATEEISAGEVVIPKVAEETAKEPQVKVEVDRSVEENEQKSVDAGHSPWKLDPVFVAQVYASLLLSPEGIVGDYPISYDDITIISNNGTDAIAEIKDDKTIAKYVYMKRLIRQDDSGIWSVVGYDPAK